MNFITAITSYINSGIQAIGINTTEEKRCLDDLNVVAKDLNLILITWDAIRGFSHMKAGGTKDPQEALELVIKKEFTSNECNDAIVVFLDFHVFFNNADICRTFRNIRADNKFNSEDQMRPVVFLSNDLKLPKNIVSEISLVDYSLPDETYMVKVLNYVKECIELQEADADQLLEESVVKALAGLTSDDAENVLSMSISLAGGFKPAMLSIIKDEKAKVLKRGGILTYVPEAQIAEASDVGGYDDYLDYLTKRAVAYTNKAQAAGLRPPRGVVLLGPPGTGKTVVMMATAKLLGLPLFLFDMSAVYGSLVGESEARMREALDQATSLNGAVIGFDECEKGIRGAVGSVGDSGTSSRVFSLLLDWLSRKKSVRTFAICTMNRTEGVPPEFLRKGRFDEIFYTDLPTDSVRKDIFRIHLRKRGIDVGSYTDADYTRLVGSSLKFVGSEIEEAVNTSTYAAYLARGEIRPTIDELDLACRQTIPLAEMDSANIDSIRKTCKNGARPVYSFKVSKASSKRNITLQ